MKKYARHFLLEDASQLESIKQQLTVLMTLQESTAQTQQCVYYDSFDWRLYKKQKLLVAEPNGSGSMLYTESLLSGKRSETLHVSAVPRFVWDLPDSTLRYSLDGLLEMRALLPQLEINLQIQNWMLLDETQNPLLTLHLETPLLQQAEQAQHTLPTHISLQPIKGKNKIARQVSKFLQQDMGLMRDETSLATRLLEHSDKKPGSYSSKLNLHLQPEMPANQAAKDIMKVLLATLRENEAGVKEDLDSEFLHDYRVAVRRTRTALTQIPFVLAKSMTERMRGRFAQLGQATTPTRDLDVYLLKFPEYRDMLPEHMQTDLEPLHDYLQEKRAVELGRLQRHLKTSIMNKRQHIRSLFMIGRYFFMRLHVRITC